jgi:ubiquinone/menaquinone biosynthesis C-methylase UbiE
MILAQAGLPLTPGQRILDFGCAAGRMMRWLTPFASTGEVWGADVSAEHVLWCEQHLNPPFNFIITTVTPHLPFEDNFFDLIYAGSVFTHIDDLAKTWLMELRRVLRPGGRLYVTLHDHHALQILQNQLPAYWLTRLLNAEPAYQNFIQNRFGMFTIGRAQSAQVFYDIDYFCQRLCTGYDILSVTPEAYGYQTAVLLQKCTPKTP